MAEHVNGNDPRPSSPTHRVDVQASRRDSRARERTDVRGAALDCVTYNATSHTATYRLDGMDSDSTIETLATGDGREPALALCEDAVKNAYPRWSRGSSIGMSATQTLSRRAPARRLGYLATLLALAVLAIVIVDVVRTGQHKASGPPVPFASDSVWNAPLSPTAPLSPQSSMYVSNLQQQVAHYGAWINTTQFSVPVYTVGASQRRVPVVLDTHGGSGDLLAREFQQGVPIPPGAQPAAGSDRHMVVWQPSTDTLWEFWNMERTSGTWHARWGGKMTNVSSSRGYYTNPKDWGGSATSLSLLGGLIRPGELRAGHIDHALALAVPHAAAGTFVAPAQRTDGNDHGTGAIPEGTRFRLNPKVNVDSLHLPPVTKELALAAQRYGIILRDQSGSVSFYGEDPTHLGTNPYQGRGGLFGPYNPAQLMRAFPWQDLQVVKPSS